MLTFCSLLLLFSTLLTDETGTTASTPAVPSPLAVVWRSTPMGVDCLASTRACTVFFV